MTESKKGAERINPHEVVSIIMALGTWLFVMYQAHHGVHYVPDEWIIGIVLAPYGGRVYSLLRDRLPGVIGKLTKKD